MKKKAISLILLASTIMVTACGAAKSATYDMPGEAASYDYSDSYNGVYASEEAYYDDYAMADEAMTAYREDSGNPVTTSENASTSNRKLIRNVSLDVETKEFDVLSRNLYESINSCGGYIENMNVYNGSSYKSYHDTRNANITARIPAKNLDTFVNTIGEEANITKRSESVEDVTLSYVDMTSHRDMLKEEQQRLLDFLAEANDVEEIIALEDRLTSVKYQLESMESQIRTYDNQVDYSTVRISITEVKDYTPEPVETKTTSQRISEGFKESIENIGEGLTEFFIWFVVNIPYIIIFLIVVAIIVAIIIALIKANNKASAARKSKNQAQSATASKSNNNETNEKSDDKKTEESKDIENTGKNTEGTSPENKANSQVPDNKGPFVKKPNKK